MNFGKALDKLCKEKCDFIYSENMEDGQYVYIQDPYTELNEESNDLNRDILPCLMFCDKDNTCYPYIPDTADLIGYRDWLTGTED